ncbi:MAG: SdrD B-like domain-containing protein [Caldilineaceae bacterium]
MTSPLTSHWQAWAIWLGGSEPRWYPRSKRTGIPGVVVTLTDSNGLTETVVTDANGNYTFTDLLPGVPYTVIFETPDGYEPTLVNVSDDTTDSDGATVTVTLQPGEHNPTIDSGFWRSVGIGDRVWYDDNRDGVQDSGESGVADVTVELLDSNGTVIDTTTTDVSGYYSFTNLVSGDYSVRFDLATLPTDYVVSPQDASGDDATDSDADPTTGETVQTTLDAGEYDPTWDMGIYLPPAGLGDRVWYDTDANGVQDAGEVGIAGVEVVLYDLNDTPVATTTTDVDGMYFFTALVPGDYYVIFTPPAGYEVSPRDNSGDDTTDSDVDPTTGATIVTTLDPGENDPTWDMGLYQPAGIGDVVWYDTDADGVQDTGETGVENVTVELLDANGAVVLTTTTSITGYYAFTGLVPGDYSVRFDLNTLPAGYVVSEQDSTNATDDTDDSDTDVNTGETVITTLDVGEYDPTWTWASINRPALATVSGTTRTPMVCRMPVRMASRV